jgi:hypothetical protein
LHVFERVTRVSAPSPTQKDSKDSEHAIDFSELLWEELAEIQRLRKNRQWDQGDGSHSQTPAHDAPHRPHVHDTGKENEPELRVPPPDEIFKSAHAQELVGLAFSGGGIRSATFNLGVLQGFADLGLLPMFDYLSTVSGGGYIGGWLETWIYRAGKDPSAAECSTSSGLGDQSSPIRRVQECLTSNRSQKIGHGESKAIRFLREYSNYLTPRLGFLGADTWTAIAIYVRNLVLNQAILILFLSFLLLLPYIAVLLTKTLICLKYPDLRFASPIAAFLLILLAQCSVGRNLAHLTGYDRTGEFPPSARQGAVLIYVAAPLILAAWCLSVWIWCAHLWERSWLWWLIIGVVGFSLTWSLGALWGISKRVGAEKFWNTTATRFKSMGLALISGATGGLLLRVLADRVLYKWSSVDRGIWHVVSFGPPLIVVIFLLVVTLQVGLMGSLSPDPRSEWWARLGGWLLILSMGWAAAFALAIYSPLGVMWSKRFLTFSSVVWVATTLTGVLAGKSRKTGPPDSLSWKDTALSVTPYIFIVGLAVALATVLEVVLGFRAKVPALADFLTGNHATQDVAAWITSLAWSRTPGGLPHLLGTLSSTSISVSPSAPYFMAHWQILSAVLDWKLLAYASGVALVCLFLAWRVNLNQFSMNLFYRNRLVRCYLGASHKFRKPNPFTGFDPEDDLTLCSLRSTDRYSGPFPIVNTALNLVKGQNLAWQERKAESFVITPLHCGFDTWLERLDLDTESPKMKAYGVQEYGFRRAERYVYPGGLRVGAAISISGAAASPNMGYHSSPSLAFLMTFFNVRLGYWAGNPRHDETWTLPGPRLGLFQLLAELFGLTDDEAKYVYLSDGGHFENLGLYELIKRRCKYIVVSDCDCDGAYAFGDLGNAIRKCREDIGVDITLVTENLTPNGSPQKSDISDGKDSKASPSSRAKFSKWHWAVGRIHYNVVDPNAADGILVYMKSSLTSDEPADVLNYHREHADFPHETTADQWFSEPQFESYRRLGQHVVEKLFEGTTIAKRNTSDIFRDLEKKWPASSGPSAKI